MLSLSKHGSGSRSRSPPLLPLTTSVSRAPCRNVMLSLSKHDGSRGERTCCTPGRAAGGVMLRQAQHDGPTTHLSESLRAFAKSIQVGSCFDRLSKTVWDAACAVPPSQCPTL
ncbi:MAG: hypothetical protein AMXMBFR61_24050 [Fimbriimonadales bacterium]